MIIIIIGSSIGFNNVFTEKYSISLHNAALDLHLLYIGLHYFYRLIRSL